MRWGEAPWERAQRWGGRYKTLGIFATPDEAFRGLWSFSSAWTPSRGIVRGVPLRVACSLVAGTLCRHRQEKGEFGVARPEVEIYLMH